MYVVEGSRMVDLDVVFLQGETKLSSNTLCLRREHPHNLNFKCASVA